MDKYSDCIFYSENMEYPSPTIFTWLAKLDNQPGFKNSYIIRWNLPFDEASEPKPAPGQRVVGHPPHIHKENEVLFFLGSDPENPYDLGAEVEICLGPDMEKHVINRSCCLRMPGGLPHGFYHVNHCERPWLFMEIHEAEAKTEKFLWDYLTPEEIESIPERTRPLWVDVGFDD